MRTIAAGLSAAVDGQVPKLVGCWRITRTDGLVLRSTESDADITITTGDYAGTYAASTSITGSSASGSADLSVDNMEASGTLDADDSVLLPPVSAAAVEAGLFDAAAAVYFLVNWQDPDAGQYEQICGTLGNIQRDSTGRWTCELRGLTQRLQQRIGRTFGLACDASFGDARCGLDRDSYAIPGTVTGTPTPRLFDATVSPGSPALDDALFVGGDVTFDSGDNAGYTREIKAYDGATIEVWEAFPLPIDAGDTITLRPGCPKTRDACKGYGNIVNYRGFPDMPGPDTLAQLRNGSTIDRKSGGGGGKK